MIFFVDKYFAGFGLMVGGVGWLVLVGLEGGWFVVLSFGLGVNCAGGRVRLKKHCCSRFCGVVFCWSG